MDDLAIIDRFTETFSRYIDSGFGLIKGEVGYLSSTLIVIDITLAGLFWAWGADEDILQRLVKNGVKLHAFSPEIMKAAHRAVFEMYEEEAEKNPSWKKIYEPWKKFREDDIL